MAIKITDELEPAGSGFKVTKAENVSITTAQTKPETISTVDTFVNNINFRLQDVENVLTARPILAYSAESGYKQGDTLYVKQNEELELRFKTYYDNSTNKSNIIVTVKKNGTIVATQTITSGGSQTDDQIISLGLATQSGLATYEISAASQYGLAAENPETLELKVNVGTLSITSSFNETVIYNGSEAGKAGTANEIIVPYKISYSSNMDDCKVTVGIYDSEGNLAKIEGGGDAQLSTEYKFKSSTYSGSISFDSTNGKVLLNEGAYTINIKAEVNKQGETKTYALTDTLNITLTAAQSNSIITFTTDTNLYNISSPTETFTQTSETSLYITFTIKTNIVAYQGSGALQVNFQYKESTTEDWTTINRTSLTSGVSYTIDIGRLFGGTEKGSSVTYNWQLVPEHNPIPEPRDYNQTGDKGTIIIENSGEQVDAIDGDLFTFKSTAIGTGLHTDKYWYTDDYTIDVAGAFRVDLFGINGTSNGFIADERGYASYGNMLRLSGTGSYGIITKCRESSTKSGALEWANYLPFSYVGEATENNFKGYTFETMINTRNVGVKDAVALLCGTMSDQSGSDTKVLDQNKLSFAINYSNAQLANTKHTCKSSIAEDYWMHIALVFDTAIRTESAESNCELENINPIYSLSVYINGAKVAENSFEADLKTGTSTEPIYLNRYAKGSADPLYGSVDIKLLRAYDRPLMASEILTNYINALYNVDEIKTEKNKNLWASDSVQYIPTLYMIRNKYESSPGVWNYMDASKPTSESVPDYGSRYAGTEGSSDVANVSFSELNSMTDKSEQKKQRVNCTVWYHYYEEGINAEGATTYTEKIRKWDDVDVYTQGTSTLTFPVKNYKFKIFETANSPTTATEPNYHSRKYTFKNDTVKLSKLKTIPFSKTVKDSKSEDVGIDGWYTKDNTFTLKCDYMEQSHRNNTPTAMFYETVIDSINNSGEIADTNKYTIAKDSATFVDYSTEDPVTKAQTRIHRDAIEGFPILMYFDENSSYEGDGNAHRVSDGKFIVPEYAEYLGSYMFNTDKASNSLGFEIGISTTEEGETAETKHFGDILSSTNRFERVDTTTSAPFTFNGLALNSATEKSAANKRYELLNPTTLFSETKSIIKSKDSKAVERNVYVKTLPMTSIEGATNDARAAAASWYGMDESNEYNYKEYITKKYYTTTTTEQDKENTDSGQYYAVNENSYLYLVWAKYGEFKTHYGDTNFVQFKSDSESGKLSDLEDPEKHFDGQTIKVLTFNSFYENAKLGMHLVAGTENTYSSYLQEAIAEPNNQTLIWASLSDLKVQAGGVVPPADTYFGVYSFTESWPTTGKEEEQKAALLEKESTNYYFAKYSTWVAVESESGGGHYVDADEILSHDVYSYIQKTFEARWAFSEETDLYVWNEDAAEGEEEESASITDAQKLDLDFGAIKVTLDWFAGLAKLSESERQSKFRSEFKNHFSYTYCMVYYLQMMLFMQVDNAGKNAMFDQWGDGVWYPRPYDMDTQMGLNNQGADTVEIGAELNSDLSPTNIGNNKAGITWSTQTTWASESRVNTQYNTPNSRLWTWFGKYYYSEICATYLRLRTKLNSGELQPYNVESIRSFVDSMTSDIIGQKFYNKDATIKYVNHALGKTGELFSSSIIQLVQGNRATRYLRVLTDRITFLDSYFNVTDAANKTLYAPALKLRSVSKTNVNLVVKVFTPTYLRIIIGTDLYKSTLYVSPSDTYKDPSTLKTNDGVLITLPIAGANNKEIEIYGFGNVSMLSGLNDLHLQLFNLQNATLKMSSLDLSFCTDLNELSLGIAPYLRELNINNCTKLVSGLSLTGCTALESLYASTTGVSGISFPETGSLLTTLKIPNNYSLSTLTLKNMTLLKSDTASFDISGCPNITAVYFENCHALTTANFNNTTETSNQWANLASLTIKNCSGIKTLSAQGTNLSTLNIDSSEYIETIDLSNSTFVIDVNEEGHKYDNSSSTIFAPAAGASQPAQYAFFLNFGWQSNLKTINLSSIKAKLSNNTSNKYPILLTVASELHNIEAFYIRRSNINSISTSSAPVVNDTLDFSAFPQYSKSDSTYKWGTFTASDLYYITTIKNLNYCGSMYSLFCAADEPKNVDSTLKLKKFENSKLTSNSSSYNNASYMFFNCFNLETLPALDLSSVTNFSCGFRGCKKLSLEQIKNALAVMPNVTNLTRFLSMNILEDVTPEGLALDASLFCNNNKIQTLEAAFVQCNITSIGCGLFKNIHNDNPSQDEAEYPLTNLSRTFFYLNLSSDLSLPHDLFATSTTNSDGSVSISKECSNVSTMASMFDLNSKLKGFKSKDSSSEYDQEKYTFDILFPSENSVQTMDKMFAACENLQNSNDGTTLKHFFDKFPNVTSISDIFNTFSNFSSISTSTTNDFVQEIPEGVFEKNTALTTIDRAFAGWNSIKKLPKCLFKTGTSITDNTTTHSNLTYAKSLFANCRNLLGYYEGDVSSGTTGSTGYIPLSLFNGAENITSLGQSCTSNTSISYYGFPGAFGNTDIDGIEIDSEGHMLNNLTTLTDISSLFWHGTAAGRILTAQKVTCPRDANRFSSLSYVVLNNCIYPKPDKSVGIPNTFWIPNTLLSKLENLTDCQRLFAGNANITGFGQVSLTNEYTQIPDTSIDDVKLFSTQAELSPQNLTNIEGMFQYTGLTCALPNYLFTGLNQITSVKGMFAECNSLTGRIQYAKDAGKIEVITEIPPLLSGCTSITNTSNMFYNCAALNGTCSQKSGKASPTDADKQFEAVPRNLFDSCRKTLKTTNGMFFGCSSLAGRLDGKIWEYNSSPSNWNWLSSLPTIVWEGTYTTDEIIIVTTESSKTSTTYNIKLTLEAPTESGGTENAWGKTLKFEYKKKDDTSWSTCNCTYTLADNDAKYIADNFSKTKCKIKFEAIDLVNTTSETTVNRTYTIAYPNIYADLVFANNGTIPEGTIDMFSTLTKAIDTKAENKNRMYKIGRQSLLANCTSLESCRDMFAGCSWLFGNIPEDLFFIDKYEFDNNYTSYSILTDISGLFKYCHKLGFVNNSAVVEERNQQNVYTFMIPNIDTTDENNGKCFGYLFPEDWASKCGAVTTISKLFLLVGNVANSSARIGSFGGRATKKEDAGLWEKDITYTAEERHPNYLNTVYDSNTTYHITPNRPKLLLPNNDPFKSNLSDVSYAFGGIRLIERAQITWEFWRTACSTIANASHMFAASNIGSCGNANNNTLFGSGSSHIAINLNNVSYMFYTGYSTLIANNIRYNSTDSSWKYSQNANIMLNPDDYSTLKESAYKNNSKFITPAEINYINDTNYTNLNNTNFVSTEAHYDEVLLYGGLFKSYQAEITNTKYADKDEIPIPQPV